MTSDIVLTGITTTGTPHLGNYVGAIGPAIAANQRPGAQSFYFLADFHALIKCGDPDRVAESSREVAAAWLALGLDTERAVFYRQSDIPEIPELTWVLSCVTAKGLMNRAHAYKAAVEDNQSGSGTDPDKGITMGLYSYPVLMAADILMFRAKQIPVGRDQVQHIEMARDIAGRFNHMFGDTFVLPEAVVDEHTAVLTGLDGRKMSKSYNNTIPLFVPEKKLRKLVMKIKTNSQAPEEPKDPEGCPLFGLYQAFADPASIAAMRNRYAEGIGWGEMKQAIFELINSQLAEPRQRFHDLLANPERIEAELERGAQRAREISVPMMERVRHAVGIRPVA